MKKVVVSLVTCLALVFLRFANCQHPFGSAQDFNEEEKRVQKFINRAEEELWKSAQKHTIVEWAYASNITDHNEKEKLAYQVVPMHSWMCYIHYMFCGLQCNNCTSNTIVISKLTYIRNLFYFPFFALILYKLRRQIQCVKSIIYINFVKFRHRCCPSRHWLIFTFSSMPY